MAELKIPLQTNCPAEYKEDEMDNFYKEHKGYIELIKELEKQNLAQELRIIVGDAIQYGITVLAKKLEKGRAK